MFTEPLWDGAVRTGMNILRSNGDRPRGHPSEALAPDVSVGEFMEEEIGTDPRLVRNLASAMMHGIYGGDVYKLSAKCTMLEAAVRRRRLPSRPGCLWVDVKDMALIYDMFSGPNWREVARLADSNVGKSLMMFEDGLISLVDALVKDLEARDNVTIKTKSRVTSLADKGSRVSVNIPLLLVPCQTYNFDLALILDFSSHIGVYRENHEAVRPGHLHPLLGPPGQARRA